MNRQKQRYTALSNLSDHCWGIFTGYYSLKSKNKKENIAQWLFWEFITVKNILHIIRGQYYFTVHNDKRMNLTIKKSQLFTVAEKKNCKNI